MLISIGTFGSKVLVFLMVRFYTDWLTPAEYGTADLITQAANLLLPVVSLGITDSVFRFALDQPKERQSIFTTGLLVIVVGSLLYASLIPLLGEFLPVDSYHGLISVYVIASCLHSLCAQYVRATGRTKLYALQGLIGTLLVIAFNVLLLAVLERGITGYVASVVLSDIACTVLMVIKEKMWRLITRHPERGLLRPMLRYSIPLIPTTIFWWITSVSDRFMVTAFLGSSANGIYTVSCKIPTVLVLLSGVFMEAWQYSAVREKEIGEHAYERFYSKIWETFTAWMTLACSLVIAFSRIEIRLLAEPEYYEAWKYLPALCMAMLFSAFVSFLGSVYIVRKKSGSAFRTSLAAAVTNLVLNFVLIPSPLGIQGAAIATLASYALVFVLRALSVRKMVPFRLQGKRLLAGIVLLSVQSFALIAELHGSTIIQVLCLAGLTAIYGRATISSLKKASLMMIKITSGIRKKGRLQ